MLPKDVLHRGMLKHPHTYSVISVKNEEILQCVMGIFGQLFSIFLSREKLFDISFENSLENYMGKKWCTNGGCDPFDKKFNIFLDISIDPLKKSSIFFHNTMNVCVKNNVDVM